MFNISAISFAYFVQNIKKIKKIYILEKDNKPGGLLRSYKFLNNISLISRPQISEIQISKDGTIKWLMQLKDNYEFQIKLYNQFRYIF